MNLARILLPGLVQRQAIGVVEAFVKACPPADNAGKAIGNKGKAEKALPLLYQGIKQIVQEQRLGIIRRASMAKFVQDELLARGYPTDVVNAVTHALTTNALVK